MEYQTSSPGIIEDCLVITKLRIKLSFTLAEQVIHPVIFSRRTAMVLLACTTRVSYNFKLFHVAVHLLSIFFVGL